jgi:hypothetical protein
MFYFIHRRVAQDDKFLGISVDELDEISKECVNSKEELECLLSNVDVIAKSAVEHLNKMRTSRRVYALEGFLPPDAQLKHTRESIFG